MTLIVGSIALVTSVALGFVVGRRNGPVVGLGAALAVIGLGVICYVLVLGLALPI